MGKGVCIVTSGHVASDPRTVKFADALAEAGYPVSVVAADITPSVRELDRSLMRARRWPLARIGRGSALWWHWRGLVTRAARLAWRLGTRHPVLPRMAFGRLAPRLAAAAVAREAALYVGVNMDGAIGALSAARQAGAALGFDAVDDHPGEVPDGPDAASEVELRSALMRQLAVASALCSTSSPMTAEALRVRTGRDWLVLRNVFPRADALAIDPRQGQAPPAQPTIYWFSQTIGPGRGIEGLLAMVARSRHRWRIDLRGSIASGYEPMLARLATDAGLGLQQLRLLPPAEPDKMTRLAGGYALGASVEIGDSPNKRQCLGNKIFQYLLAGTPVLLSSTPAQAAFASEIGAAALLVDLDDPVAAARRLDSWWEDVDGRAAAREAAWSAAHQRLHWDAEKVAFLSAVRDAIGDPPGLRAPAAIA